MSVRVAVFDCDGTLIDGQASICEAMEHTFAAHGLPAPDRNTVRRAVGLSLPVAVRALHPEGDEALHGAMVDTYKTAFRTARLEGRIDQPLIPGIVAVLDALRAAGWELAVATGMSDRGLVHCLEQNAIADRFSSLQTADRHPSKPHAAMLEEALFETGGNAQDAVMIGDTAFDMAMAVNAATRGVGVAWGYHTPEDLTEAGAAYVAATPEDLSRYLLA